jgi:hypothetical protein
MGMTTTHPSTAAILENLARVLNRCKERGAFDYDYVTAAIRCDLGNIGLDKAFADALQLDGERQARCVCDNKNSDADCPIHGSIY